MKNQVENHSKIDNSINNQKSKISESNFSQARKEKRDNMLSPPKFCSPSLHQHNFLSFPVKLSYAKLSDQFLSFVHLQGFWCLKNYAWY